MEQEEGVVDALQVAEEGRAFEEEEGEVALKLEVVEALFEED